MFQKKELETGKLMQAITIASKKIDLNQHRTESCVNGCMAQICFNKKGCLALEEIDINSKMSIYLLEYIREFSDNSNSPFCNNWYELGMMIRSKENELGKFRGYLYADGEDELYRDWDCVEEEYRSIISKKEIRALHLWSENIIQNKESFLAKKDLDSKQKAYIKRKWYNYK